MPPFPHLKSNGSWRPVRVKELSQRTEFSFDSMEDTPAAFARGEPIVVMDDKSRESEGDIIMSPSKCTIEAMAWMIKHTRSVGQVLQRRRLTLFQRLYLHFSNRKAPSGTRYSDDGSAEPRTTPHR